MLTFIADNLPFSEEIKGLDKGYQGKGTADAPGTIELIVSNTVGFITVAGGVAFIIYTAMAALTWITAREEADRISKAKQQFVNALIGLAMMVSAYAFTGIMQTVFGFDILDVATLLGKLKP